MSRNNTTERRVPGAGRLVFGAAAVGLLGLLGLGLLADPSATSATEPSPADLQPLEDPTGGYVSSDSCRSCHPGEYASWHASFHRTMTQKAGPETVVGDFGDVDLTYHGWIYHLRRDGDLFYFEAERQSLSSDGPDAEGKIERFRRPIVQTTGSHHLQAYWYPVGEGRALEFFPFIYMIAERTWIPRESAFLQPTVTVDTPLREPTELERWQSDRAWNHSCIHCHTTDARPGFPALDTRVSEFGIACEACHGPGEEHVARNHNPTRRYESHLSEAGDDTIVQPADLGARSGSVICGSCHAVANPKPDEVQSVMANGYRYQPGDRLEDDRLLMRPSHGQVAGGTDLDLGKFWSDGMLRVSGREYTALMDAPCFASPDFGCTSCHRLHPDADDPRPRDEWRDDQLHLDMRGNAACVSCHTELSDDAAVTAHSRHAAASTGAQCMNCHMGYTSYGLLKTMRNHQIDSPSVAVSLQTGRPNTCNQCHLDQSLAWTAGHLESWFGQAPPVLPEVERSIPAAVVWSLRGDAGQRVLMAWTLGWQPALEASGRHWTVPLLAQLMLDPYDAVRIVVARSLRTWPDYADLPYDPMAPPLERQAAAGALLRRWQNHETPQGEPEGFAPEVFARLLADRDQSVVRLTE